VTWADLLGVGLLAVAGFLVGGAYSAWRTARMTAVLLIVGAVLAAAAGVAWLL
jgi:hypothetical protein